MRTSTFTDMHSLGHITKVIVSSLSSELIISEPNEKLEKQGVDFSTLTYSVYPFHLHYHKHMFIRIRSLIWEPYGEV